MIPQVLHCPYCQGIDIVRHGKSPAGKQRYRCRQCREGSGRTSLLAYTYAGQSPEVKQQIVAMAMNASGIRDTARVLHVSPTTVLKELKKRNLTSPRGIRQWCSTSILSRSQWRYGVRMRWRCVMGSAPSSTRCGATCTAQPIRAGDGMRWITTQGRC
jgi:transposase-like protein